MKSIAWLTLVAMTALVQVAHAQTRQPLPCPEGTYPTSAGHCQPEWDFD
ncbi:hypothetical protein ACLUS7_02865 [Enterobacterales bacterium BD_CKDN230030183-1A_HGKHYDSX7]